MACLLHGAAFAATFEQKTFLLRHNPISTPLLEHAFAGPFAGVFFQASAPLVQVKNDLGLKVENETKVTLGTNQLGPCL